MGIWNTIGEVAATMGGDKEAAARFHQPTADRQALAHEELEAKSKMIWDDVKRLQDRRAALDPKSPTYTKEIADIDASLHQHQQAFTDLYHPEKNPGALQHLGKFLKRHHESQKQAQSQKPVSVPVGTGPPVSVPQANIPTTPAQAKASMADLQASAAGGGTVTPNKYAEDIKALVAVGVPQEEAVRIATKQKDVLENWVPTNVKLADGREVTLQRNSKDGRWTDLAGKEVPQEILSTAQIAPKAGAGGNSKFSQEKAVYEKQWGKPIADWTPEELSYFNQKMAYDAQRSGQSTTTRLEKDQNGVIHPVEITNTRGPSAPPVDPHAGRSNGANIPKTPAEAKSRMAHNAPTSKSSVKEGAPLSFKGATPSFTKAKTEYDEAVKLDSIAKQVEQKPDDAVNQKRLAVALERVSAGRFTTQALDYIVQSGIANSLEGWINKAGTGALPKDVMRQLIEGAHQNLTASKAALDAAQGGTENNDDDDTFLKQIH